MNIVIYDRIMELTDKKPRNQKLISMIQNWKYVAIVSVGLITLKSAVEQLFMLWR